MVHIVFSTKKRTPFLSDKNLRNEMHSYLGGTCKNLGCPILNVGGVADHVHILCMLARTFAISKIVCEIKRASSKWIKTEGSIYHNFAWQRGFGAFSVGQTEIKSVRSYIHNQQEHHQKKSFKKEYLELLEHYGVRYDERYLWK
jgi:REP element-mobilizing transposase RayT